jgi:hypothetical protein
MDDFPRVPLNPQRPPAWGRHREVEVVIRFDKSAGDQFLKPIIDYCLRRKSSSWIGRALLRYFVRSRLRRLAPQAFRIDRPPGWRLHALAVFLCKKKTLEQVVEPLLADLQHEYYTALAKGRPWKARWGRARDTIGFFKALGLSSLVQLIKDLFRLAK